MDVKAILAKFWEELPPQWKAAIGLIVLGSNVFYWGYHFSVWTGEQLDKAFQARAADIMQHHDSQIGALKTEIGTLKTEVRSIKDDTTIIKKALIKR